MARDQALTEAVRRALEVWPASRRDLASRAGVPHGTLTKIAREQLGASPDVAERLLAALQQWQHEQRAAAAAVADASQPIREALRRAGSHSPSTEV
jgi:hypothetical protein